MVLAGLSPAVWLCSYPCFQRVIVKQIPSTLYTVLSHTSPANFTVHLCLCCFFMRERERDVYKYMCAVCMGMLFPEERDLCSSSQVDFHPQTSQPFVVAKLLSHVRRFATPWTVAHQAPLSMGFPRQESSPGESFQPGIETESLTSPSLAGRFLTNEPPGRPFTFLCQRGKGHSLFCIIWSYLQNVSWFLN